MPRPTRPPTGSLVAVVATVVLSACHGTNAPADSSAVAAADAAVAPDVVIPASVAFSPVVPTMRRLTRSQYTNSIQDTFGTDIVVAKPMEPDSVIGGFYSVAASETSISARGVEQYEALAYDLAAQLTTGETRRAMLGSCRPAGVSDRTCAEEILTPIAHHLWRRPLAADEVTALVNVATSAGAMLGDFYKGIQYGIATVLQSPDFLFRQELGSPDAANPGHSKFTGIEMASRLSYFLWDGPPDDALLTAAEHGDLDAPDNVHTQVARMLASPRAHRGLRAFVTQWLQLYLLDNLTKDTTVFTAFSADIGAAAREETLMDFERLVFELDGDVRDILTSRETYVNRKLASLYAVRAPVTNGFGLVTLPSDSPRRGLLGQISFLALESHPTSSSPTERGRFIRTTLLCSPVPSPPVNVNTALPPPTDMLPTLRQRLQRHATDTTCNACHSQMDPVGLGLESFDGLGVYRRTENGITVDSSGSLDDEIFSDASGLAQAVHDHPELPGCITRMVYRFAGGHLETDGELAEVNRLQHVFRSQGYKLRSLMETIATSDAFGRAAAGSTP